MVVIPAETTYTEIELDIIDLEPPGLFPVGNDSLWGQVRKIFADYLTANIKIMLDQWYLNIDPRLVDINDIAEWEFMVGIPAGQTGKTLQQRSAQVVSRLSYGSFTRADRIALVESSLVVTFGPAASFGTGGLDLSTGIPLLSGANSLVGLYTIVEDLTNFAYTVYVDPSVDTSGLLRILQRATPAGIQANIVAGSIAATRTFGSGTFGSGTFGG